MYNGFVNIFLFYILYSILLYFVFPELIPSRPVVLLEVFLGICMVGGVIFGKRLNLRSTLGVMFLFLCIVYLLIRCYFILVYNNPFGYTIFEVDSDTYHDLGKQIQNMSWRESLRFLGISYEYDDFGFPLILGFVYSLFPGENSGLFLMLLLNALVVTFTCNLFYKLCRFFFDHQLSKFLVVIWGFSTYITLISVRGLKENFFLLGIIGALYFMYVFLHKKSVRSLILFFLFACSVLLFRRVVAYMLFLTGVFGVCYSMHFTRKMMPYVIILGSVFAILSFEMVVNYIGGEAQGFNFVSFFLQNRLAKHDNIYVTMGINILSGFIGPIPDIIGPGRKTIFFMYNFSIWLKSFFSIFYLYGMLRILQNKVIELFPFLAFILMHTIMLVAVFWTMSMRYQLPMLPAVMVVAAYGFQEHLKRPIHKWFMRGYFSLVCILIFFFNYRFV